MSARAILSPKVNSLQFDDRVLLLDVPAKIGRSHKDDQVRNSVESMCFTVGLSKILTVPTILSFQNLNYTQYGL